MSDDPFQRGTRRQAEAMRGLLAPETGTWVPFFSGSSTIGGYTYSVQQGTYAVMGGMCFVWGWVQITAIGTAPTGAGMAIGGLPITSRNTTSLVGGVTFASISAFNYTASALQLTGYINPNDTYIYFRETFDNAFAVDVPASNFTNANCGIIFSGVYPV